MTIRIFTTVLSVIWLSLVTNTQAAEPSEEPNPVPVIVTFRQAKINSSLVAQFTNTTTDKHLEIEVTVLSKTLGTTKTKVLRLNPGESKPLGWTKGFSVASGDSITVREGNYGRKTVVAP